MRSEDLACTVLLVARVENYHSAPAFNLTLDVDEALIQQFRTPVHCADLSNDGYVYVCDRPNDRLQVFTKDGKFVTEKRIAPRTLGDGSCARQATWAARALCAKAGGGSAKAASRKQRRGSTRRMITKTPKDGKKVGRRGF